MKFLIEAKKFQFGGKTIVLLIFGFLLGACHSGAGGIGGTEVEKFQELQPRFPVAGDDQFFLEKSKYDESFRVLITGGNYQIRQIRYKTQIKRVTDVEGDREQLIFYQKKSLGLNFKDWDLEGTVRIRINPLNQQIEHISYLLGATPDTWQASVYFQEDVSRLRFAFPGGMSVRDFRIRYNWRVKRKEGLSDTEARKKAIEYLKSQKR